MSNKHPPTYSPAAAAFLKDALTHSKVWTTRQGGDDSLIHAYIHDVQTSYTWVAAINLHDFMFVARSLREQSVATHQDIAARLANLIVDAGLARSQSPKMGSIASPGLFQLLAMHAGSTSCIFEPGRMQPEAHFISVMLGTSNEVHLISGLLPPVDLDANGPLTDQALNEAVASIIATNIHTIAKSAR